MSSFAQEKQTLGRGAVPGHHNDRRNYAQRMSNTPPEGLPEDWRPEIASGHFQTGKPPRIDDSRVSFRIGWFDETLPRFAVPDHDQIVINVDSDLYSSASTVLRWAEPYLRPGTLIYFDEFWDRDHEMRAFNEFRARSSRQFKPLAIAHGGEHWLFEVSLGSAQSGRTSGRLMAGSTFT